MSEDWGAQYARMRQIIKGVHGALTDAGSVVVPGTLEGDLAPAIRQLTRERDDARAALDEWRKLEPIRCDCCDRVAVWFHPLGGKRCSRCPRPKAKRLRGGGE